MKKPLIIVTAAIIMVFSCSKDDSPTTTELLTKAPWQITSSIIDPPLVVEQGTIIDEVAAQSGCIKDDLWILNSGGTFFRNEGDTKCQPDYYDVWDMGLWALSQDELKIYEYELLYTYDYIEYDILNLTPSEMQLRFYFFSDSVTAHSVTRTYQHP